MEKLTEFALKWINTILEQEDAEAFANDLHEAIQASIDFGRSQHIQRPTTDSQEREFAELMERESAEDWPQCDYGKTAKIVANKTDHGFAIGQTIVLLDPYKVSYSGLDIVGYGRDEFGAIDTWEVGKDDYVLVKTENLDLVETKPVASGTAADIDKQELAGPLREMPEEGERYYVANIWIHDEGESYEVEVNFWGDEDNRDEDLILFQAGLCFPYTPEGKAGAELRAQQGILPPIDQEELRKRYKKWQNTDGDIETPTVDFLIYIKSILEGGSKNE